MTESAAPTLDDLGPRICILGPSNSGKSTLALAISRARDLPLYHLDQLHHLPGSDWRPRPRDAFVALHGDAIAGERWVMDGNYSGCLPQRLARATGIILLDASMPLSLIRYFRRTIFERGRRIGGLDGSRDSVKWLMVHHILVIARRNQQRYAGIFRGIDLPKLRLRSSREIARFRRAEGLD